MRSSIIESAINYQQHWNQARQVEFLQQMQAKKGYFLFKRGTDIAISLLIIVLILPWFFPLAFILIKLTSRGPLFFRQERIGFLGKTFRCYKFRTMYVNEGADTVQAVRNDPRVTRIGRFLRYTGLDELPQFLNVLRGDMSIVGPRPHMLKDSIEFEEVVADYKFRNMVRPGITGMSQVRGYKGPATTFQSIFRRFQWDAYYVRNVSFWLDLTIMTETAVLVIKSVFQKEKQPESECLYEQKPV